MTIRPIKISVTKVADELSVAIKSLSVPVAEAATDAIIDAGALLKSEARTMIASAGFSRRWQNAYRVNVYPSQGKKSIDAAAYGRFRNVDYADIFATGGSIRGKPMLWIPLSGTPKIDRRKTSADITDYRKAGIKLFTMSGSGHRPLLGAQVMMSRSAANRGGNIKVSINDIKSGVRGSPNRKRKGGLVRRTVPLFFGISVVSIRRRFNWDNVLVSVQSKVPALYEKHINRLAES